MFAVGFLQFPITQKKRKFYKKSPLLTLFFIFYKTNQMSYINFIKNYTKVKYAKTKIPSIIL